ncbi:MAG: type II secretion system F family protein [Candidatus Krumholzibacteriia bacterium]
MSKYRYTAKPSPQEVREGTLEADSTEAAFRILQRQGLFPVTIRETGNAQERDAWEALRDGVRNLARPGRIRLAEKALVARQLSDLLGAGLTVLAALRLLEEQASNASLRQVFSELHRRVREGQPLSAALQAVPKLFPKTIVGAIRAGETSGTLPEVLANAAELLEEEENLRSRIRESLTYPVFVAGASVITLGLLFTFLIPRLTVLYENMGQALPLPTRVLLGAANALGSYGLPALGLLGLGGYVFRRRFRDSEALRARLARTALRVPLLGRTILQREIFRFARSLATLIDGGVPIVQALGLAADAAGNEALAQEILRVREEVLHGARLGQAMRTSRLLSGPLVAVVQVGDETAEHAAVLRGISTFYKRNLERDLKRITALIEPVLIVGLGLVVAFVVFSMMLPILQVDLGVQ